MLFQTSRNFSTRGVASEKVATWHHFNSGLLTSDADEEMWYAQWIATVMRVLQNRM